MTNLKAGLTICALSFALTGVATQPATAQSFDFEALSQEISNTEFGRRVVNLYTESLNGLLTTEQQSDVVQKQIQGRINTVARCAAQRSYMVGITPASNQKQQFEKEMNLLTKHYVYFALAMERQGMAQSDLLISQFKSGSSDLGVQIGSLYETAKTNSQYKNLTLGLSKYCKGMADEMEQIESVITL